MVRLAGADLHPAAPQLQQVPRQLLGLGRRQRPVRLQPPPLALLLLARGHQRALCCCRYRCCIARLPCLQPLCSRLQEVVRDAAVQQLLQLVRGGPAQVQHLGGQAGGAHISTASAAIRLLSQATAPPHTPHAHTPHTHTARRGQEAAVGGPGALCCQADYCGCAKGG
jgi:hypothetical protein